MNEHYERRIDLKWLFYRILRSWRLIVLSALIAAVLVGGVKLALNLKKVSDPAYITSQKSAHEKAHAEWQTTIDKIDAELANIEKSKDEQQSYNENSMLMQINPLREYNASFELYLDYDYQIMPELTYQNIDLSDRILKAYNTYMTNGEMYRYILENFSAIKELRYLKEILTVSVDYPNNMLTVSVKYSDATSCEQLLTLAKNGIYEKRADIANAIGKHELTVTNTSSYETVDLELEKTQKKNLDLITEFETKLKEKQTERDANPEPVLTSELTNSWAISNAVKFLVLAAFGVAFAVVMIIACYCILTGKLMNPMDIRYRFGIRIIAQLPKTRTKKPFAFVSRWICALGEITTVPEDFDRLAKMSGTSIKSDLCSRDTEKAWGTVAFSGSVSAETLQTIIDATGLSDSYTTVNAADILTNADSIEKLTAADCAVLVVEQERTLVINVAKELEALKAWGIPVLGVIITNTDAVM